MTSRRAWFVRHAFGYLPISWQGLLVLVLGAGIISTTILGGPSLMHQFFGAATTGAPYLMAAFEGVMTLVLIHIQSKPFGR